MITTTIGAALVSLLGSRLLRKTKFAVEPEQWRRSHRPSVRDISIIEEDEEVDEDSEAQVQSEAGEIATMDNNDARSDEISAKAPMEKDVEDTLTLKLRKAETVVEPRKSLGEEIISNPQAK